MQRGKKLHCCCRYYCCYYYTATVLYEHTCHNILYLLVIRTYSILAYALYIAPVDTSNADKSQYGDSTLIAVQLLFTRKFKLEMIILTLLPNLWLTVGNLMM